MLKVTTYWPVKGLEQGHWPSDRCSAALIDCGLYMWNNSGLDPSREQEYKIGAYRIMKAPEFMCVLSSIQETTAAMQLVPQ